MAGGAREERLAHRPDALTGMTSFLEMAEQLRFINVALARAVERTETSIAYPIAEKQPALMMSEKKAKFPAKKKGKRENK